jgi:DNA-binding transcriptional LysR family regulator
LVANGFGFGIVNMRTASETAADGKPLIFVVLEGKVPPLQLGVALSRTAHVSRTIQAFIDHCHETVDTRRLRGTST